MADGPARTVCCDVTASDRRRKGDQLVRLSEWDELVGQRKGSPVADAARWVLGGRSSGASDWLDARAKALGLLGGACVVLFGALYAVAVETRWGHRAGNAALAGRQNQPPALVEDSLDVLGTISTASLAVAGGTLCVIGLVRGGWRLGAGVGCTILLANVSTQLLKKWILPRPFLVDEGDIPTYANSLPSGHATVAMSLAVAIVLVAPPRHRWLASVPAGIYAIAVGSATITAGWHRPSDVMAASLVAVFWGAVVAALLIVLRKRTPGGVNRVSSAAAGRERLLRLALLASAALLTVASGTLMAVVVNRSWSDLEGAEYDAAYWTGVIAGAASVMVMLSALVYSLRRIDLAALVDHLRLDIDGRGLPQVRAGSS